MNVRRAVQLFSTEMTAGLRVLQKYGPQFGIEGFSDALPTIEFMERMYKWFTLHNIQNVHYYIISRR
ncbi:hypothetical protein X975_20718, partial [Stegodyphus mimosarum]